ATMAGGANKTPGSSWRTAANGMIFSPRLHTGRSPGGGVLFPAVFAEEFLLSKTIFSQGPQTRTTAAIPPRKTLVEPGGPPENGNCSADAPEAIRERRVA